MQKMQEKRAGNLLKAFLIREYTLNESGLLTNYIFEDEIAPSFPAYPVYKLHSGRGTFQKPSL